MARHERNIKSCALTDMRIDRLNHPARKPKASGMLPHSAFPEQSRFSL
jgi:hypothetical protein